MNNFAPHVFGFFGYHEDTLVGVAPILSDDGIVTFVVELCVHKDWQRRGIGTHLMKTVIDRFDGTAICVHAFVGQEDFFKDKGIPTQSMLVTYGRSPRGIPHKQPSAAKFYDRLNLGNRRRPLDAFNHGSPP